MSIFSYSYTPIVFVDDAIFLYCEFQEASFMDAIDCREIGNQAVGAKGFMIQTC